MLSFIRMRDEDPNFAYSWQMDSECRITSLMWCSGNSRRMYREFGDVVTFDTTFKTNIYDMPFGMFVGVNNHFQSVIFAGVLLTSEDNASFKWVFETFTELMGGKAPTTILTDQCAAMGAAIREVWPEAEHLWCKWHVLKKVVETLGHVFNNNKEFNDDFNKVVNHMLSPEEFEAAWHAMVEKYGLGEVNELKRAFESRELWAKAWSKHIFCARMSSTQRSESANHVLKNLVPRNSPLNLFVKQYTQIILEQEKAYHEAEKKTKQCAVKLKFRWPIEAHAASLYTWAAYELFLEELTKSTAYVVVDTKDPWVYNVVHVEHERRERWSKVEFKVCVDQEASHYHCECGLYTHFGIPCCHSLLVMVQKGVREIPPVHIMRRWTRDISIADESGHMLPHGRSTGAMKSKFFKDNLLENTAREVINLANTDGECFEMAMKQLVSLMKKLQKQKEAIRTNCHVGYQSSGSEFEDHGGRTSGSEMFSDSEGRPLQIIDRRSGEAININSLKPPLIRRNIG